MAAIKVHAKALTPGVSENISIIIPRRKARVNKNGNFMSIGNLIKKYIKTKGTAI